MLQREDRMGVSVQPECSLYVTAAAGAELELRPIRGHHRGHVTGSPPITAQLEEEEDGLAVVTRVLQLYPEYWASWGVSQAALMAGPGSLALPCRHYIAHVATR